MKQILISNIDPNWPNIEIEYDRPVKLYVDCWDDYDFSPEIFKILYLREPNDVSNLVNTTIDNQNMFDLILTTSQKLLDECPHAKLFEFGTTWIWNYKFPEKKFQISSLFGFKDFTEGHKLRRKVYYKQKKITNPTDFYISKNGDPSNKEILFNPQFHIRIENVFGNKTMLDPSNKEELFNSQFHICIENTKQDYFFSEKVMDCFRTKTVPIFWGCPKIGNYFNVDGMIIVNSLEEIIESCNGIDANTYETMLPFIEENYKLSEKYVEIPLRMKALLDKTLSSL